MKINILGLAALCLAVLSGWMFKQENYGQKTTCLWLLSLGVWLMANFPRRKEKTPIVEKKFGLFFWALWLMIGLILIFKLDVFLTGVWTDEIEISMAGRNLWQEMVKRKSFLPFTPEATGHPGLTSIFTAVGLIVAGNSSYGLRLPSVIFGWLAIVPFCLLVIKKMEWKIGLTAMMMYGLSYWQLSLVRIAYEAGYFWFFFNWCLWAWWSFHLHRKTYFLVLLGVFCGLGLYTYQAFRLLFLGFGLSIIIEFFLFQKEKLVKRVLGLILFGLSFGNAISPFFFYWRHYPETVFGRANDVSIFNHKFDGKIDRLSMITENSIKTMGIFFWQADPNRRHNIAKRPVLNAVESALLIAGVALMIKRKKYFWLITTVVLGGISAASGILTYEPPYIIQPHSLRILGLMPLVYLIMTEALAEINKKSNILAMLVAVVGVGINTWSYFGAKIDREIYDSFQTDQTRTAKLVGENCGQEIAISRSLVNKAHFDFWAKDCQYKIYTGSDNSNLLLLNKNDYENRQEKDGAVEISWETWSEE